MFTLGCHLTGFGIICAYFSSIFNMWQEREMSRPTSFTREMSRSASFAKDMSRNTSFAKDMSRSSSFASDGEILDGMVTRSRGEIRRMCSLKHTSCSETSSKELKSLQSPRVSEKVYSPRVSELKGELSPRQRARGPFSPSAGESKPSNLAKSG